MPSGLAAAATGRSGSVKGPLAFGYGGEDLDVDDGVLALGDDVHDTGEEGVVGAADHEEATRHHVLGPNGVGEQRPRQVGLVDSLRIDRQHRAGSPATSISGAQRQLTLADRVSGVLQSLE
jgi:hypothetical protein